MQVQAALESNFEGLQGERVRQILLAAPKYGNDIDEVDAISQCSDERLSRDRQTLPYDARRTGPNRMQLCWIDVEYLGQCTFGPCCVRYAGWPQSQRTDRRRCLEFPWY
jgi:hypothetical protein